jgi:hypothetical protein
VDAQIRQLEKVAGTLPMSLRAFYEIVGSVDWIRNHPHLSAARPPLCIDPFVVLPIEAALEFAREEGESILIAPDELMKAETSGGDPYQIEVPNLAADRVLDFECNRLYFVEYLRLVFRFDGLCFTMIGFWRSARRRGSVILFGSWVFPVSRTLPGSTILTD